MVMVKQVVRQARKMHREAVEAFYCLLYTSDAADEL